MQTAHTTCLRVSQLSAMFFNRFAVCLSTVISCRDVTSDPVECPADFRRLFEAVSTNYPTAAFFHPAYAAGAFQLLLHQQHHITLDEAADMHCGFPLLHAIIQKRQWDDIPADWAPFLEILASKSSAADKATPVSWDDIGLHALPNNTHAL